MSNTTLRSMYDIPTISFNYRSGRLVDVAESRRQAKPSDALNQRVSLVLQDLTTLTLDAILNAANQQLQYGSGINGAVHDAAGPGLIKELGDKFKEGCDVGSSVVTGGHNLPCRYIIHAVSPRMGDTTRPVSDAESRALATCYTSCLAHAEQLRCESLGLCCMGIGIYKFPKVTAADIACREVRQHLEASKNSTLKRVVFVVFTEGDLAIYEDVIP